MRMIRIKPRDGVTILNPDRDNRPLRADGEDVPLTVYWQRRLNDGDVVAAAPRARKPRQKPAKPAEPPKAKA